MQLLRLDPGFRPRPGALDAAYAVPAGQAQALETLRAALRRTRAASAMLADMQLVSDLSGVPALDALCIRLSVLSRRPLRGLAGGTPNASFDEAWLLGVFAARARGDAGSYRFLLRSRLSAAQASELHFLVSRAASALHAPV